MWMFLFTAQCLVYACTCYVSLRGLQMWDPLSTTPCLCGRPVRRSSQSWLQAVILPERAVQDNVSPCFSGCSRPEHSRVRCAGGCRHERAHRLMASMGLSRLDDLSLRTQYSRTAGDTASSSSLTSPRLFELFQVIAFCLYITWALSLAIVVELILFRLPSCSSGQSGCARPRSTCLMIWRWFEVVT